MSAAQKSTVPPLPSILLLEDEEHLRQMTAAVLERSGFTVLQACDAIEAADLWKSERESIDVLIADILVPSGSGLEVAVAFRQHKPALRVIFTSGNDRRVLLETQQMVRGAKFIRKPYTAKSLLDLVRSELSEFHDPKDNSRR